MQRLKQLGRSAVYWPKIDQDIERISRQRTVCAEFRNGPAKPAIYLWMLSEKPWSRLHIDHGISFLGHDWLVLMDAYSKYPCIHMTDSTSIKATTELLEPDFAHFGYTHTLVMDNATTVMSQVFHAWCKAREIIRLTGAPCYPAINGVAEHLVQTFEKSLRKSRLPPKEALREFLMQYRRTILLSGYSPGELLNGRQIRTKLDAIVPSPAHTVEGIQARGAMKSQ